MMNKFVYFILGLCLWGVLFYLGWGLIYKLLPSNDLLIVAAVIVWAYCSMYLAFCKIMKFVDKPTIIADIEYLAPEQRKTLKKYVVSKIKEAIKPRNEIKEDRDKTLKDICIAKAGNCCEIDASHRTFLNKQNKNYVEAHHIIPLSYQSSFNFNLDTLDNMICLCPNCHKSVHYGSPTVKEEILKKILQKRPIIDFDKLKNFY